VPVRLFGGTRWVVAVAVATPSPSPPAVASPGAVIDVSGEPFIDLRREAEMAFARD
jgi:hypothetical protein